MQIEICELTPGPDGWELNGNARVAVITVQDGEGSFVFDDPSWERKLREIFEEDFPLMVAVPTESEVHADGLEVLKAWEPDTIRYILEEGLYGHSLGGRILV